MLYYFGEERLINYKKANIRVPYNIGVILDNQKYEMIIFKLLKFINWNLKLGVNYINLYDPFHVINQENFKHFKNLITIIYSKKFYFEEKNTARENYHKLNTLNKDIILINNNEFYNVSFCQTFEKQELINDNANSNKIFNKNLLEKNINNANHPNHEIMNAEFNLFKEKFKQNKNEFLIIKLIDFKQANIDFKDISKIKDYENDTSFGLIENEVFDFYKNKASDKKDNNTLYNIDPKFLTRKETNFLPEIIINFARTELCMFGFPFALMENCEIL